MHYLITASVNVERNIPGLDHHPVNHSLFFVDLITGIHTENIKSYWNSSKVKLKAMKGVRRKKLPAGYLKNFMWREQANINVFNGIVNAIMPENSLYQVYIKMVPLGTSKY